MIIVYALGLLAYLLADLCAYGLIYYMLAGRRLKRATGIALYIIILIVIDLLPLPFVLSLDATLYIGNEAVREIFGLAGPISVSEFLAPGIADIIFQGIYGTISYLAGMYIYRTLNRKTESKAIP